MDQAFLEEPGSQTHVSEPAGSDATAKLAYDLWLSRQCPHDSTEEDWYEGERILERHAGNVETLPLRRSRPNLHRRRSKAKAAGSQTAAKNSEAR